MSLVPGTDVGSGRAFPPGVSAVLALAILIAPARLAAENARWGPGARLRLGEVRLQLDGYTRLDTPFFLNWEDRTAGEPLESAEADLGRARASLDLEWRRLSFQVEGDAIDDNEHLKDLWVGLRLGKGFRLRAGAQKLPVSGEWLTPSRRLDFFRRSLPVEALAPGRDWGAVLHGERPRWLAWDLGVFAGDHRTGVDRAQATLAGRVLVEPVRAVRLGFSFSHGQVEAAPVVEGEAGDPRGARGDSVPGFTYFPRKYVDGRRLRLGAEASWRHGPFSLRGEVLQQEDERLGQGAVLDDLPAVRGRGYALAATWLLTGEEKKASVKPRRALPHGPGAIELAARLDGIHWDDVGTAAGFQGAGNRSRNLLPAGDRAFTAGVSWWPVAWVRLAGDLVVEHFTEPLLAPEPGRAGNYLTLMTYLQLEVP